MRFVLPLLLAIAACSGGSPEPTGAVCPDPDPGTLTYDNFGKQFMETYCTWCHDSHLPRPARNGAPVFHDYDSFEGVLETANHIDEQAGIGPDATNRFMPPGRCPSVAGGPINRDCPQPTDEERKNLAVWLACESGRSHTFVDAGVDAP